MNYDVITKSTNAMWRYATNNDKRLGKAVEKYLKEGLEAPGIAKYLEIENMADYFADRAKYMDCSINRLLIIFNNSFINSIIFNFSQPVSAKTI